MMNTLKTSQAGLEMIKLFEGLRLEAYLDPVGILTCGWGHTSAAGPPVVTSDLVITEEEANAILLNDLKDVEYVVNLSASVPLPQDCFDALVSFTFNVGSTSLMRSTLLKRLNMGDWEGAAGQFKRWNKGVVDGKKVAIPGLTARRSREEKLFRKGMTARDA